MAAITRRQAQRLITQQKNNGRVSFRPGEQALLVYRCRGKRACMTVTIVMVYRQTIIGMGHGTASVVVGYRVQSAAGGELDVSSDALRPANALDRISAALEED